MDTDKEEETVPIEYCGIVSRIIFLIFAVLGFVFSLLSLRGCDFILYRPGVPPPGTSDNRDPFFQNITTASVGLFKYDPDAEGCRDISDDIADLSWQWTTAQTCAILAFIFGVVALVLALIDFIFCRFPCSRILISFLFIAAFICQILTMLVYTSDLCQPNYHKGQYTCSPELATWLSVVSICLFLFTSILACCIPKPVPVCVRVREQHRKDESDGWCAFFVKKEKEEEKGEEVVTEEEVPEEEVAMTPEELEAHTKEQQTYAMVTTALTTARRGKVEEIEKELVLLEKYKEHMPEEEYNEKVTKLMQALPDPETYDSFTKTGDLVVLQAKEEEKEEEVEGEGEGEGIVPVGEEEEGKESEEPEKKSRAGAAAAAVGGAATAVGSAVMYPFKTSKKPEETPPVDS